jgi:UDP-N-acetylglucosamine 2-epimerase (non-hydrolysing)
MRLKKMAPPQETMPTKRVMVVVGARPNFMKAAPLLEEMQERNCFETRLVHTRQHFDENMSQVFFNELDLPKPDSYLKVNKTSQVKQVARAMIALENEINNWRPDLVVVVGDVNSTLSASLVANKLSIKLAHVEAGLRSFDRTMPEETNRVLVDQISDFLFTPSSDADKNLFQEGVSKNKIFRVGNIMIDTLLKYRSRAENLKAWEPHRLKQHEYALVTLHRPSNVDDPKIFESILSALNTIQKEIALLFPVHPRTRAQLETNGWSKKLAASPQLFFVEPLGYLENLSLMTGARFVITDSGGMQEETTVLGVPCLTARTNTERPITISQGTNQLVGQTKEGILKGFRSIQQSTNLKPFFPELWDGHTAKRIVDILTAV